MDERENLVTSEGFDWLYGEDADGSVLSEPPAIGAVTERAGEDGVVEDPQPFFEAHEPVDPVPTFDETFDPMAAGDQAVGPTPSFDETFDPMAAGDGPVEPVPTFDETFDPMASFEESLYGSDAPEAQEDGFTEDTFDPAELDESFGPPTAQGPAGGSFSTVQAPMHAPEIATAQAPPPSPEFSAPPPPPPPPAVSAPVAASVEVPVEEENDDSFADVFSMDATSDALTARMTAVPVEASVPMTPASSRGDIIPAGNRKLTVRDHLTISRGAKVKVKTPKAAKSKGGSKNGTRAVASVLCVMLSLAGTAWRFERIRRLVFGGASAPTEQQVDASFVPLKGFSYTTLPEAQMAQFEAMAEPIMPPDVEHWDVRLVGPPANPVGMVMIFAVDPKLTTPQQWEIEVQDAMSPSGGMSKGEEIQLAGTSAIVGTPSNDPASRVVMFQDPDGMFIFAFGRSPGFALDAAKQLIKGNI